MDAMPKPTLVIKFINPSVCTLTQNDLKTNSHFGNAKSGLSPKQQQTTASLLVGRLSSGSPAFPRLPIMANVAVTVETSGENQVVEVGYDGQEILAPPLTLAEHLAKQASKIDFEDPRDREEGLLRGDGSDDGDDLKDADLTEADETEDEDESDDPKSSATWPWEPVRNKLRDALTEMSVLADVITVATKECGKDPVTGNPKRYMVLDGPVQLEQGEGTGPRPYVSLLAKKKSLDGPAKILLAGAEHLKTLQSENKNNRTAQDFHFELLRLRQNWRLKKVLNTILGDLSYRTAGSQFKQSGVFEVVKSDENGPEGSAPPGAAATTPSGGHEDGSKGGAQKSALKVNVPSDLEGIAYIQVTIQTSQNEPEQLLSANLSDFGAFGANPPEMHWQKKLEAAQNVLFCKELFSQLAKEAIQLQAPIPHMVVGNQISASLFTDIQLIISLCHSTGSEKKGPARAIQSQLVHSHVLEHSLHQLLRLQHSRNINPDAPALSSAPIGISKRRRLAGPRAADRQSLIEMATQPTLLEQIIQQAQHVVLRLRTMFVLDTMARELKDPLISCHLGTLSSPIRTSVKVSIVTSGYDSILRTPLVIHVGEKQLTVVCKDGRVLHFSHEPQEFRDFIFCQISQHQINGVQALAKCMGWHVLSSSNNLGCGSVEPMGGATGCLLSNPAGDRFIAIRHIPPPQTSVWVSSAPCKDFYPGGVVKDRKWEKLPDSFQELRLDKMDGKNLLNKLELLMASLSGNDTPTIASNGSSFM
eukprot:TCALIF_01855-PA protein Name:"Similar to MED17 Mediator of RNA polymerase II transcription subunit 17 (Drosophila melanogaster)" AED:0.03 eAED:0.03 QI:5/1/0/1/1/0.5/2/0/757